MTIEQTVEIPADHRLMIEVPPEIPAGRAVLAFTPAPENPVKVKPADSEKRPTPISDRLLGIASQAGDISLDELRAERLSKYLK
ncbi:MAG: hypothetical protein LBP76_02960 [Treponema sp.]|jgi:hypothetical protein|nr:hypothetical protein [Treponema sp.]